MGGAGLSLSIQRQDKQGNESVIIPRNCLPLLRLSACTDVYLPPVISRPANRPKTLLVPEEMRHIWGLEKLTGNSLRQLEVVWQWQMETHL